MGTGGSRFGAGRPGLPLQDSVQFACKRLGIVLYFRREISIPPLAEQDEGHEHCARIVVRRAV